MTENSQPPLKPTKIDSAQFIRGEEIPPPTDTPVIELLLVNVRFRGHNTVAIDLTDGKFKPNEIEYIISNFEEFLNKIREELEAG